jgi:hypothetical protein
MRVFMSDEFFKSLSLQVASECYFKEHFLVALGCRYSHTIFNNVIISIESS